MKPTDDFYDLQKPYCGDNRCRALHSCRLKRDGTATRRLSLAESAGHAESGTDGGVKHGAKKHGCESKHFIETGGALRPSLTS